MMKRQSREGFFKLDHVRKGGFMLDRAILFSIRITVIGGTIWLLSAIVLSRILT